MANRTVYDAKSVHGTNPQYLVEKILRARIYDSLYWKEQCFALTGTNTANVAEGAPETLIDKAVQLNCIGGHYGGNMKPTVPRVPDVLPLSSLHPPQEFMCLCLKMLQIQPDRSIVLEYMHQEDFKYLRALGAYYWRLTARSEEVYKELEPLLEDWRKLRERGKDGGFIITHMDDFIDSLIREERVCDVQLPRLAKREMLEEQGLLEMRDVEEEVTKLGADENEDRGDDGESENGKRRGSGSERSATGSGSEDDDDEVREDGEARSKSNGRSRSDDNKSNGKGVGSPDRARPVSSPRSPRDEDDAEGFLRRYLGGRDGGDREDGQRSINRRSRSRSPPSRRHESPPPDRRDRDRDRRRSASPRDRDRNPPSRGPGPVPSANGGAGSGKDLYEERAERKKADRAALEKKVGKMFKSGPGGGSSKRSKDDKNDRERPNEREKERESKGGGNAESMSIEETNKLRASLGLKPLK
ncbi:Pre-mRNA-splicing factor 38A [Gonapodya sp. JEL0774]|nr:Pre-mRNA-splicing factor 38A [Gonapodya sp. JEL0774]